MSVTYAKLFSVGDLTPYGAPMTVETKGGARHVVMLEPEQCLFLLARLEAICTAMEAPSTTSHMIAS